MTRHASPFAIRLAATEAELRAAQALRFRVFVEEKGARADPPCLSARREWDAHDGGCEHLILTDALRDDLVVGTARLMDERGAARSGGFATEAEFDIAPLRRSGRGLLELGRICLDPDHRCGAALHLIWQALGRLVVERRIGLVFGLASLPGTDPAALSEPLALLHAEHRAPEPLRPTSLVPVPIEGPYRRREATLALPSLVKGYLRLGGVVGEGAFVDHAFGCTDVCMVLDVEALGAARLSFGMTRP